MVFAQQMIGVYQIRDVASERPGGAAPPRNLSAPPGKFAHHTFCGSFQASYQFISYIELHCSSYYAPNHQVLNFTYKNNNVSILFSWLKHSVPHWTPPGNFAYLSEYIFWLHSCKFDPYNEFANFTLKITASYPQVWWVQFKYYIKLMMIKIIICIYIAPSYPQVWWVQFKYYIKLMMIKIIICIYIAP